ncbi:MAG: hypothetical protein ACT4QG_10955 [Sporichthyaceae bacterium]
MDFLRFVLLALHVAGMAVLVGAFALQAMGNDRRIVPAIFHAAGAQLVTGLALVGVNEADDRELDHAKVAVKLTIALVVVGLTHATRRRTPVPAPLFYGAFGLAVANLAIAYAWT